MKIINVAGVRPNFMKIAPLMEAYKAYPSITPMLVHTGQHYDEKMSDLFFRQFEIPKPDVNPGIGGGSHALPQARVRPLLAHPFFTAGRPVIHLSKCQALVQLRTSPEGGHPREVIGEMSAQRIP